jgi:membrane protease YdiL (CAAX protease family)
MKNAINWKLFFILLAAGAVTTLMVLPYALTLIKGTALVITPVLLIAQVIQAMVLFSIAIFFGLFLAKRVGFGLPILEGMLKGEKQGGYFRSILGLSISLGVLASGLIILFSFLFGSLSLSFLKAEIAIPTWMSFLASFYGGVGEEILLRLFVMTLLVWMTFKIKKTSEGKPTAIGIWLAIIASSVLFGLGHLPITGGLTAITLTVVIRAVLLNGVAGILFGWLYWKKGLESAMVSHFTADICLHVILPLIGVQFV